jgi:hypothetical protein
MNKSSQQIINGVMVERIANRLAYVGSRNSSMPGLSDKRNDKISDRDVLSSASISTLYPGQKRLRCHRSSYYPAPAFFLGAQPHLSNS